MSSSSFNRTAYRPPLSSNSFSSIISVGKPPSDDDSDEEKSEKPKPVFRSLLQSSHPVYVPIPVKLKKISPLKQVLSWVVWNTYGYDGACGLRALYAKNPEGAIYHGQNPRERFCTVLETKKELLKECLETTVDQVFKGQVALESTIFFRFSELFSAYQRKLQVLEDLNKFYREDRSVIITEFFQKILSASTSCWNEVVLNLDDLKDFALKKALFHDFHRLVWKGKEMACADYGRLADTPDGEKVLEKLFFLFPKKEFLISKFLKNKKNLEDNLQNQKFCKREFSQFVAEKYGQMISQEVHDIHRADISLAAFLEGIRVRVLLQEEKGIKVVKEGAKYFRKTVTIYQEQEKFFYCTHISG